MTTKALQFSFIKNSYDYWVKKNWYYHRFVERFYAFIIPPGNTVLHINCKTGNILHAIKGTQKVGIDTDSHCISRARSQYPGIEFICGNLAALKDHQPFDYIILSSATMEVDDIQELFESLHAVCHERTRIVIDTYSCLWEPLLRITQKLGLRRGTPLKNWISQKDLANFLHLANFEPVTQGRQLLLPCYIPLISRIVNGFFAPLPLINKLCLNNWIIARPQQLRKSLDDVTVSVIVPCRNEAGNVEAAITRTPLMGKHTEFIYVEGNSKDDTLKEIQRVQAAYPDRDISWYVQDGKGKGDAVRKGFDRARGDILLILDGDLTTPPEEMPKFVQALVAGKGEFINGSRLIYGMEDEAMRFCNMVANHGFAIGFSWLLGQPIKDTLCGTKVLYKHDYEKIVAHRSFFGEFDPFGDFDLLFGAAKQNMKIVDMPIHYKNRSYGTTQISRWRSGVMLLYMSWIAFKKFKLHFTR